MKKNKLPVLVCHTNCTKCGLPSDEFMIFESGLGGDFETYLGEATGSLYRLDLGQIYYEKKSRADLIVEALKKESRMITIPNELMCKFCGTKYINAKSYAIDREEIIEAYEL